MEAIGANSQTEAEPTVKYVIKRDGTKQPIDVVKIRNRFVNKAHGLNTKYINFDVIVNKVNEGIYSGMLIFNPLFTSCSY